MHGNAKYDANEKAFVFDGTTGTYMSGTQTLGTGTPAHTITGWFKQVVSLNNWTYVMFIGTSVSGQMSGLLVSSTGQIVFDIYNTRIDTTVDAKIGTWHHFAGVFKGGTSVWDNASTDLYINGQLEGSAAPDSGTQHSFNLTGNGIQFGSSTNFQRYFNGFISQFKLYDTALTAEEVKTLYDMGRLGNTIKTPLQIETPIDIRGDIRYITNIRPLPQRTMWSHEANGHFTRGIYPITGTQGGSKVYNVLCEPDWCGGGWMCAAQLPRGKDVVTTTVNLFTADYGDPSNLTWSNDFAVPMNVFSNNSGYDLDVMLVIVGGSQAGRAGSGGARNGGIYRGVNLEQALNTGWPTNSVYPANISTSGLASSNDGFHFVSRTPISGGNFQPYKANNGWRLSFGTTSGYSMAYNDSDINTMGWLVHVNGNVLAYTYSYVHGGGGSQNNHSGANTDWAAIRFFVRPKRY
tara:strand:+ start:94 stop:1479 length:1386 start_codon:yes stop_codon:yes gene_type:complete